MLDICLLGTGGMMSLSYRWPISIMVRCGENNLLIDCGEGTQITLKEKGWSPKLTDIICFTHYHADHISGLPGLLLTVGSTERRGPLTMIGPKGPERVVTAFRTIAPELPFPLQFIELTENRERMEMGPYVIDAYRVNHNMICYGYSIIISRKGCFDVERVRAQDILQKFWNRLQKGEEIEHEGRLLTPDMVLGEERRGLKVIYCTDTRPVPVIAEYASMADLFTCEGMYGEKEKAVKAKEDKHTTFYEVATLAKEAQPKQMWLIHYSPSLIKLEEYMDEVKSILPCAKAARDGRIAELEFDEE